MDRQNIKRKIQIIDFELTTPLVSLTGFCEHTKKHLKSKSALTQLKTMKEAIEHIKNRRDFLREKNRAENDPDLSSVTSTVNYLRQFALELQAYEKVISLSTNRLLEAKYETKDLPFEEWAKKISTLASVNLSIKLEALRNIQPDLELIIQDE